MKLFGEGSDINGDLPSSLKESLFIFIFIPINANLAAEQGAKAQSYYS